GLWRSGGPGGQRTARRLSMSWRSLQRQLAAAGTTFRAILDDTRFRFAREWLGEMPIKAVADRLGYADQRAFDRAFRRWAGTSPMHYLHGSTRTRRAQKLGEKARPRRWLRHGHAVRQRHAVHYRVKAGGRRGGGT